MRQGSKVHGTDVGPVATAVQPVDFKPILDLAGLPTARCCRWTRKRWTRGRYTHG